MTDSEPMTDGLTPQQQSAYELLPMTSTELSREFNISLSRARSMMSEIRDRGYSIQQDSNGQYYDPTNHDPEPPTEVRRDYTTTTSERREITREARERLAEMEARLSERLDELPPARASGGLERIQGNQDIIFFRTDDHFGQYVENEYGEAVYSSEIAESRVREYFDHGLALVEQRQSAGLDVDTAHLLLNGDIVTNECIYEGQPHEIDETVDEQIDRAGDVYIDAIRRLADRFPTVQVICQAGNHGEIRTEGSSSSANADGILYSRLDTALRVSDIDNVTFVRSGSPYYVNFNIRGWNAHMRHGHGASLEHIGTSAGKQRWLSWMADHDFDVAFRGHYHMLKEEPINGAPVIMGGSPAPQSDFEESRAISGRAMGAIHGASDEYPLEWTDRITFE